MVKRVKLIMNDDTRILITGVGGGGTGMELIKAFKIAPHKYTIIATDISENSFGLSEVSIRYLVPPSSSDDYIEKILSICKKESVQVIVPGTESELLQIARNVKKFDECGIIALINPLEVIERCLDKFELMNYLIRKGVSCPYYFLYESEEDVTKVETYPVIIKPRRGGGSQNVFIAQDNEEFLFFCRYLKKYGMEPLVQEYLHDYQEEYTVGVLYADNGILSTSIAMKRVLDSSLSVRQKIVNPHNQQKYIISSGISQGLIDDFKQVRKVAIEIAKSIDANGPVNIQCRKIKDEVIPFEVNPRFSGTTGPRSIVGFNEPDIFCRYKLYNEIPDKIKYNFGYVVRGLIERYLSNKNMKPIQQI